MHKILTYRAFDICSNLSLFFFFFFQVVEIISCFVWFNLIKSVSNQTSESWLKVLLGFYKVIKFPKHASYVLLIASFNFPSEGIHLNWMSYEAEKSSKITNPPESFERHYVFLVPFSVLINIYWFCPIFY